MEYKDWLLDTLIVTSFGVGFALNGDSAGWWKTPRQKNMEKRAKPVLKTSPLVFIPKIPFA